MAEKTKKNKVLTVLDVIFDSITFISIQYILLCCMYAFRTSIVYVFFIALNTSLIVKYWSSLQNQIPNKILFAIVFILNFVVLGLFTLIFGYLEISPILKEII